MNSDEVLETLLRACPAIKPAWQGHVAYWNGEEAGKYNDIAVVARYLADLANQGDTDSLGQVFVVVERCLAAADDDARGLIIVGLLEGLQNITSWTESGYAVFEPLLGPRTLQAWRQLEALWQGKNSVADVFRSLNTNSD